MGAGVHRRQEMLELALEPELGACCSMLRYLRPAQQPGDHFEAVETVR